MKTQTGLSRWVGLAASFGLLVTGGATISMVAQAEPSLAQPAEASTLPGVWRPASAADEALIWRFVLQSPMGVAALNQLAIEGFISPLCEKTFYTHATYESFQTLLQVQCPTPGGVSTARAYDEMRITFNRFEDTIDTFSVERVYTD
ncbi:hypothetical protein [Phormidium tenue]|uniref:Uncharacterized protein n=1 Tax=Phormidium tenue NIES-30 TaxID=549789 RepID=A0A1U7J4W2_9CYAN|nr:hypothetical protein [Phormidium tenue]MBD2232590.1 hypothetical protein [Phormidium tenue FACHB-1052]OKH47726.1 hypothetical protein NIES30_12115 [Phormidium tenue NIES-30]